jgi:hypothetical protein
MIRKFWMLAITIIALFSFINQAGAQIAVPTAPVVSFITPIQVTKPPSPTGPLTATFSVSGYPGTSYTPTPILHYGINFSLDPTTPISCGLPVPVGGGETCTVKVYFNPTLPGGLKDAVMLQDKGTGNWLFTDPTATQKSSVLLGGIGLKSLALIQPGVVTNAVPSPNTYSYLYNSAIDDTGVAYVTGNNASPQTNVWRVAGGAMTPVPVTITGRNGNTNPNSIAIDGAGVLYIAVHDYRSSLVTYDTVTGVQGTFSTLPTGWPGCSNNSYNYYQQYLDSVAVDQWGNIFVHEELCQEVIEFTPGGSYIATNVPGNPAPEMLAVDANDNIFVTGPYTVEVSGGAPSTINASGEYAGLAVDAAGTLYLTRWGVPGFGIGELAASNYAVTLAGLDQGVSGEIVSPLGLGLATDGTVFVGDYGNLDKVDRSKGTIDFGQQSLNQSVTRTVGVYNGGNQDMTVDSVTLTPTGSVYSLSTSGTSPCSLDPAVPTLVPPGALCNVQVTLNPDHNGSFTGTVNFTTDDPLVQTVTLNGYVYGPYFTASPSSLDFGYVAPNPPTASIPSQTVTLTNNGLYYSGDLSLTPVSAPAGFTVSTPAGATPCNQEVAVGGTCKIAIAYDPTTAASSTGTITFNEWNESGGPALPFTIQVTATSALTATTTTVTSLLNPSPLGQSVTFYATVVPFTAPGTVQFSVNGNPVGSAVVIPPGIGEVFYTTSSLMAPSDTIGATYTPDAGSGYAASSGSMTEKITPLTATTTTVTSLLNPSPLGQSVTFYATVVPFTAPGTVQFSVNGNPVGSAVVIPPGIGEVFYTTSSLMAPSDTIGAAYTPAAGSGYAASSGSMTETISTPASLTSPTQGATLAGSSQSFTWNPAAGATGYTLWLGSSAGSGNLFDGHTTGTTLTANNLPVNGKTIYARLITNFNGGVYAYTDTTFTAVAPASLTSPTQGTVFTGTSVTFTWAPVAGATSYVLFMGSTGVGSGNLLDTHTTATTITANNLPANGETIYARLITNFNGGVYAYNDYTFTAVSPASLTSPMQGTVFTGTSVAFTWTPVAGATSYVLFMGSTGVGSGNLLDTHTTATTITANNLPANGKTIYARLITNFSGGVYAYTDYTFTAVSPASLTSPTQGTVFTGTSVTFTWTPVAGATSYVLFMGSTGVGSGNLLDTHTTATTITANNLPANGKTIYARLITNFSGGVYAYTDYTFTAVSPASLTSPTPGATLAGSSQSFTWVPVAGATGYNLFLGSTGVGSGNLLDAPTTTTTVTANNLPVNGETIYARLWTNFNGRWVHNDYTFTAK